MYRPIVRARGPSYGMPSIERLEAETIEALCEGYPMMRVDGQYGTGPAGLDERPLPVLARLGDTLSCVYYRPFIERAAVERGKRLSDGQRAALDRFDEVAASNDLALRLELAPGRTLVLHNRFVLHARTDYVDWPELERRRHLRRVWIDAPDIVPVADVHRLGDIFAVDR